ncbi:MAG: hypothetical protein Q9167_006078 [Letrouitia subvulpina]
MHSWFLGKIANSLQQPSEIKAYYPPTDQYYQFYDPYSAASMHDALSQLCTYISIEGPFDGVIGFSQGASLAATFLIQQSQDHPLAPLPFKCAIFLSGGKPLDPKALERGEIVLIDPTKTGPLLHLPTANIWGRNDMLWPGSCETLCSLCDESMRSASIHDEGHDVPGAKDKEAVQGAVRAIRRTIDKALMAQ